MASIAANRENGKRGGRPKGVRNKAIELRNVGMKDVPEAWDKLIWLSKHSPNHAIQLAAVREIFDRTIGRAPIAVTENSLSGHVINMLQVITNVPEPEDRGRETIECEVVEEMEEE